MSQEDLVDYVNLIRECLLFNVLAPTGGFWLDKAEQILFKISSHLPEYALTTLRKEIEHSEEVRKQYYAKPT